MEVFISTVIIGICAILIMLSSSKRGLNIRGGARRGKSQDQLDVEEVDKNIKRMESVGVMGLLSPEELADEANYVSKYSENSYIQNNTRLITQEVSILTPSFNSDNFVGFAKDIFSRLVKAKDASALGSIIDKNVDMSQLPESIERFDVCYLHNYIVKSSLESLKLLITINKGTADDKYFLIFSRKNPAITVTKGEPIAINCPSCGGNISFAARHMITNCPYCNNVVTFAEYDWSLISVEHITADTEISNRAVIKQ